MSGASLTTLWSSGTLNPSTLSVTDTTSNLFFGEKKTCNANEMCAILETHTMDIQ